MLAYEPDLPSLIHAQHAGILRELRAHALWTKLVSGRSVLARLCPKACFKVKNASRANKAMSKEKLM
ncbi:hypothetical protein A1L58_21795 [Shewanella baltica]|nr:hypothetical protein A1L58_21795 [Shewanella baltica]